MTLPNASTISWTQPANGSTVVVKNPALAALPEVMPLSVYDAAQGFTWLTFAILAGSSKQIAGISIGDFAFIFVDHKSRPWLIDLYVDGVDWVLRVKRRFGLFGSDQVSWIENRIIYSGDFGYTGAWTEYLAADDLCQNWTGSSVMLNFRKSIRTDKLLAGISRVVEINITTVDASGGADVSFTAGNSHRVDIDETIITTNSSYDNRPSIFGYGCNTDTITTGSTYNYDPRYSAWCGPGAYRPGVYTEDGTITIENQWEDGSGTYGSSAETEYILKIWYGHDNTEQVLTQFYLTTEDNSYVSTCDFNYSASFERVVNQPDNGDDNGSGLPCSGLATITWSVDTTGSASSSENYDYSNVTAGGFRINGQTGIMWVYTNSTYTTSWAEYDYNFSASGSYTEGDPENWPSEFDTVRSDCQSGTGYPIEQSSTSGNTSDPTSATIVDGDVIAGAPEFANGNQFVRAYCNNAFALVLISLIYPEDDPLAPAYFGQYGLWVNGQRPVTGFMTDKSLEASANPVDGSVTVDYDTAVCYA